MGGGEYGDHCGRGVNMVTTVGEGGEYGDQV